MEEGKIRRVSERYGIPVVVDPAALAELSQLAERAAAKADELQAAFATVELPTDPPIPPDVREALELTAAETGISLEKLVEQGRLRSILNFKMACELAYLNVTAMPALPAVRFSPRHDQVFKDLDAIHSAISQAAQLQFDPNVERAYRRFTKASVEALKGGRRIKRERAESLFKARRKFEGPSRRPEARRTLGGRPTRRQTCRARAPARPSGSDPEPVGRSGLRGRA